ncbi:MAG: TolC family protein [Muribaculaceae bacterium]|nr:TolC family protein [Muribaculaceae bacterium]
MNCKSFIAIIILGCVVFNAYAQNTYSLDRLKSAARQNNHALGQARRNIEAAGQQRAEAFTKYFPSVSATGLTFNANKGMASMTVNPAEILPSSLLPSLEATLPTELLATIGNPINISMMKNGTIAGVTLMQPIFAGGQIINGNRLAKVGEDVSKLQLALTENEVDLKTEQYYWQLISLQQKTLTLQAVDTLLSDIYKDVDAAVSAGVAMRNDLLQVQLRQNELASQRLKLNNGYAIVKLLLSQHCGLNDTTFRVVSPDSIYAGPVAYVNSDAALSSLAEYQLLNKQIEAAELNKKMAIGQNLPTVAVGAGYNYHNLLDNDRHFAMVFATISIPISNWWGGSHAIRRSELQRQNAIDQMTEKTELLNIRMRQSWNEVEETRLQLDICERSIEQAKENLRLNRDYYNAGISKMSDLLEAQLLYQQALDGRTDAFVAYQINALKYRQATAQ